MTYSPSSVLDVPVDAATASTSNPLSFPMSANSELTEIMMQSNYGPPQPEDTPNNVTSMSTLVMDDTAIQSLQSACAADSKPHAESAYAENQFPSVSTISVVGQTNIDCPGDNLAFSSPQGSEASHSSHWTPSCVGVSSQSDFRNATSVRSATHPSPQLDSLHIKTTSRTPPCSSPSQAHFCNLCGKQYRHGASLRNHMRKHESGVLPAKRYRCPHCIYSSQYNRNVTKHIDSTHKSLDNFYPVCSNLISQPTVKQNLRIKEELATKASSFNWTTRMGADSEVDMFELLPHVTNDRQCTTNFIQDYHPPASKQTSLRNPNAELADTATSAFSSVPSENSENMPCGNQYHSCPRKPYRCDVPGCIRAFKTLRYLTNHLNDFHNDAGYKCSLMNYDSITKTETSNAGMYSERRNSLQELLSPDIYDSRVRLGDRGSPSVSGFSAIVAPPDGCYHSPPTKRQHSETSLSGPESQEPHRAYDPYPTNSQSDFLMPAVADVYSFPGPSVHSLPNRHAESTSTVQLRDVRALEGCAFRPANGMPLDPRSSGFSTFPPQPENTSQPRLTILPTTPSSDYMAGRVGSASSLAVRRNDRPFAHGCLETPQSTVEQLLCASDMSNDDAPHSSPSENSKLPDIFYDGSAVDDSHRQVAFDNNSHFPTYYDIGTNRNDSVDQNHHCSSTPTADSDSLIQGQLNSEADAFFSDLEEILAREQPMFERDTPNCVNSVSVDSKEFANRSVESSVRSPLQGSNSKLIGTASLLSGDSGLESWSSSSSCSAGPNSASVWGSQEGVTQMKTSPLATTPQPPASSSVAGAYNHRQQCYDQTFVVSQTANGLPFNEPDPRHIRPATQTDSAFASGCFDSQAVGLCFQTPASTAMGQSPFFPCNVLSAPEHPSSCGQPLDSHTSSARDFLHLRPTYTHFTSAKPGEQLSGGSEQNLPDALTFTPRELTFTKRASLSGTHDHFPMQDDVHHADAFHGRSELLASVSYDPDVSNSASSYVHAFGSPTCGFPDRLATGVPQIRGQKSSPYPLTGQNSVHGVIGHPKLPECGPINPYSAHENCTASRTNLLWQSMPSSYQTPYNSSGIPHAPHNPASYEAHSQKAQQFTPTPSDLKSGIPAGANLQPQHPQSGMGYVSMDRGNPTILHAAGATSERNLPLSCTNTAWPMNACHSDYTQQFQPSQAYRASYFTPQMYESNQHHTQLSYPSEPFVSRQPRCTRTETPDASVFAHHSLPYQNTPHPLSQFEQQQAYKTRNCRPPASQSNRLESKIVRPFKLYCQRLASSLHPPPCTPNTYPPVGFDSALFSRASDQLQHHPSSRNSCRPTVSVDSGIVSSWSGGDQSLISGSVPSVVPRGVAATGVPYAHGPQSVLFRRDSTVDHPHHLQDSNAMVLPFDNSGGYNQLPTDRISPYAENRMSIRPSRSVVDSVSVEQDIPREQGQGVTPALESDPTIYIHRNSGAPTALHNDWPAAPLSEGVHTANIPQLSIDRQFGMNCPSQLIS
ncbi:unnamed protein product [Dicrocoelium dendriticum]|nr:unnamed protein product [Dicrocoelium dendriticum]